MKKFHLMLFLIIASLFTTSCEKKDFFSQLTYNQKSNELIQQIVANDSCGCILEMQNESMIKSSISENRSFNIKREILKKLHLKNTAQLDSLEKISESFILDTTFFKQKNIKIIKKNSLEGLLKSYTSNLPIKCPNGVLYFSRPILDERNKTAILFHQHIFNCSGAQLYVYNFKDGKWLNNKN